jgi:hypothetical protein
MLALWNPVDYSARLLQPWMNLSKGPASASRTLLLDLISPLQPNILISAANNFEWPVVLTTSIAMALTIVVCILCLHAIFSEICQKIAKYELNVSENAFYWNFEDRVNMPIRCQLHVNTNGNV